MYFYQENTGKTPCGGDIHQIHIGNLLDLIEHRQDDGQEKQFSYVESNLCCKEFGI